MSSATKSTSRARFDNVALQAMLDGVETHKNIILSKQTNQITNKKKEKVWEKIAAEMNAVTNAERTGGFQFYYITCYPILI